MIYLLEDDNSIRDLTLYALSGSGLEARGFERPSEFWAALEQEIPTLLLLDVMLPEEDGIAILQKLRKRSDTRSLPVIMLTARSSEYDKVVGLDNGADDYVTKPFGMLELISRVKALLRRSAPSVPESEPSGVYKVGQLYVSQPGYIVRSAGEDISLTLKEFELLCLLLVTEYGIAINPRRTDLLEKLKDSGLPLVDIQQLREIGIRLTGAPKAQEFTDRIIGVVEYRDGTVIDVVRQPK